MSNDLIPIEPANDRPREPRVRYVLKVHGEGFVGGKLGKYHFMYVSDMDLAARWESPEAIEAWLRDLPGDHAKRLMGKQLFVVKARMVADRIVAAWTLSVPVAAPET